MSYMKIDSAQVKKVAKLASLPLTSDQEEEYSKQLSKILEYIEQLNQVETAGILPIYNVSEKKNVLREDVLGKSFTQDEVLQNTTSKKNGQFVTKGVFEEK